MPFRAGRDASADPGELVFWKKDPDNGEPVRFRLRRPDGEFDRQIRKQTVRGLRAEQLRSMSAAKAVDRGWEIAVSRASHVLLDSENFAVLLPDPKAAAVFGEALGQAIDVGAVVVLDGKWNDAVKAVVFETLPALVGWINDKADELLRLEAEDEDAAAESFR
jgi:hypothetical protein